MKRFLMMAALIGCAGVMAACSKNKPQQAAPSPPPSMTAQQAMTTAKPMTAAGPSTAEEPMTSEAPSTAPKSETAPSEATPPGTGGG